MKQLFRRSGFLMALAGMLAGNAQLVSQIPAFPGAEGHGRYANGGRGGRVIEVTHLGDNGEGSLRAAVEASGSRTVVFRISGTIRLESSLSINNDSITIAGQTAPGDGITLRDYPVTVNADNVVIRFIRFRMGDVARQEADALGGRFHRNIIIDHCSMSWSTDECVSFYQNEDFTLQWCIVAESLRNSVHEKGAHGYGGIWGGRNASFHHNLLAHHSSRNPRLGEYAGSEFALTDLVDLRNNVIYNWGGNSCYGGEAMNVNIVNCYYKAGPATTIPGRIVSIDKNRDHGLPISDTWGKFYIDGNVLTASPPATDDNWTYGVYNQILSQYGTLTGEEKQTLRLDTPLNPGVVTTHSAGEAYQLVLEHAGASLSRDTVDLRILHDVATGTATVMDGGNGSINGIIDTQEAVGGWPELHSLPAPVDSDSDGMPDAWESARGLDPEDPEDRNGDRTGDGYTNLEEYLNSLVTVPWDLEPMVKVTQPRQKSGYLLSDTVRIKAISGAQGGGEIASFDLLVDDALSFSADSLVMDTLLTGLASGSHLLIFEATDQRGNRKTDSVKIYVGSSRYSLQLVQGDGSGQVRVEPEDSSYVEGTELTLFAVPDVSYQFLNWSGDTSSTNNPLKVIITADTGISANFTRSTGTYALINFQPPTSFIPPDYMGDVGEEYGPREEGLTYGWVGTDNPTGVQRSGVDDPRKATFIQMQKNGDATWEFRVPPGRYAVDVHLGDGRLTSQVSSLRIEGIERTDTVPDNYFEEYYLPGVEVVDGALTLVPTGENTKINFLKIGSENWKFGRYLVVMGGFGDGEYRVGETLSVNAYRAGGDMAFYQWSGDTAYMENVDSSNTTLTMADQDLLLQSNYWKPIYTLTVNNGSGSGDYERGQLAFIIADPPLENQVFDSWVVDAGDPTRLSNPGASTTWITMPEQDMEVTATYKDITGMQDEPNRRGKGSFIYPNPAGEAFFISMEDRGEVLIRIYDAAGRLVDSQRIAESPVRVNTRNYPRGIYEVLVTSHHGKKNSYRLILQ